MPPAGKTPPDLELLNLVTGHWRSRAVYLAAKLGVADVLADGPQPVAVIAEKVSAHPRSLYRLLRALAGLGIFLERGGRFELTPVAELLRSDTPSSMRSLALTIGGAPYAAWGDALYSVQTGKPAFDKVHGASFFEHLARDTEAGRVFDEAMRAQSSLSHAAVVAAYDFSRFERIVDVGGGTGSLLERILRQNPGPNGVVFDQPQVVARGRERLAGSDLAARMEFVGGDFLAEVPAGDLYILAMVIHDWDDETAVKILSSCRRAMMPGAKLVLSELVIPPGNAPFFGKLLDLDMLVDFGGCERTADEYRALLDAAGLKLTRILPAYSAQSVLSVIESEAR
jgi:ubiquinone/menaquinone biosynthesis C-methylase UbiE